MKLKIKYTSETVEREKYLEKDIYIYIYIYIYI